MKAFSTITGIAVPFLEDDVNTDKIAPIPTKRSLKPDYREMFFHRARRLADDTLDPDHVFNRPQFSTPSFLVAGHNFGCGSSREGAVWTMQAVGIHVLIARSIADLYRENCLQNGLLPIELPDDLASNIERRVIAADGHEAFTVDLVTQTISGPGGNDIRFDISAADRMRLLEGLDDIGLSLKHAADIAAFEETMKQRSPWLQRAVRHPGTEPQK